MKVRSKKSYINLDEYDSRVALYSEEEFSHGISFNCVKVSKNPSLTNHLCGNDWFKCNTSNFTFSKVFLLSLFFTDVLMLFSHCTSTQLINEHLDFGNAYVLSNTRNLNSFLFISFFISPLFYFWHLHLPSFINDDDQKQFHLYSSLARVKYQDPIRALKLSLQWEKFVTILNLNLLKSEKSSSPSPLMVSWEWVNFEMKCDFTI